MKLLLKINFVLCIVFAVGFVTAGYVCNRLLQQNAKAEIMENARIMMEAAIAVRTYTATQIKPLPETQIKYSFLPQSVPAYSANAYFSQLQKKFPDYSYKEATLNPTNPINRATDWEADLVEEFRKSRDKKEIVGERDTPNGRSLYIARPMAVSSMACLSCHDTAEDAPRTMVERYGSANGFGWKLNDIVTAQIVSVPTQLPLSRTDVLSHIEVADGRIWLLPEGIDSLAGDLSEQEKKLVWATQCVSAPDLLEAKVGGTAWKSRPSWYIVAKKDRTVHPDCEPFPVKHMGATTTAVASSHVVMLSQPQVAIDVIRKAVKATQGATAAA